MGRLWGLMVSGAVLMAVLPPLTGCRSRTPEPRTVEAPAAAVEPAPRVASGKATLLLLADIRGTLKPCGCTADLQKGGFDRLGPHLAAERAAHPGAKVLHAGPLFYDSASVEPAKAAQRARQVEVAAELLAAVGVDVAAATAVDLAASNGRLGALLKQSGVGVTAANLTAGGLAGVERWVVLDVGGQKDGDSKAGGLKNGGLKIGVFAIASADHSEQLGAAGAVADPVASARAAVAALSSRADVVVLLSELGLRHTKRLVRKVEGIDFAIAGGLGEYPVASDEAELVGKTRVMQFHREGRYVGRLSLDLVEGKRDFVDASAPSAAELAALDARIEQLSADLKSWTATRGADDRSVRNANSKLKGLEQRRSELAVLKGEAPAGASSFSFHVTSLDWDLPQDPTIAAKMDAFDEELKGINLASAGTLPEPKPGEAVYVGVDECLECHDDTANFWEHDIHAKAWETLEEGKKTFDIECVHCHVTGYGKAGGSILGKTEGLEDVQCEACHGPGSLHVESDGEGHILLSPDEDTCADCHNSHHSPRFDFKKWRKRIIVPGHGLPLE